MYIQRSTPNQRRKHPSILLVETVRIDGKFKKRTLAVLTTWSEERLQDLEGALRLRRAARTQQEGEEAAVIIANLVAGHFPRNGRLDLHRSLCQGHYLALGEEPWHVKV